MQLALYIAVLNLILGLLYLAAIPPLVARAEGKMISVGLVGSLVSLAADRWYSGFFRYVFTREIDIFSGLEVIAVIRTIAVLFLILLLVGLARKGVGGVGRM